VSPHTRVIPLTVGALLLIAACGAPPESLPAGPPLSAPSAQPGSLPPGSVPVTLPPATLPPATFTPLTPTTGAAYPTYPTPAYPTPTATRTATATPGVTNSPTPTPAHAPRCVGEPTKAQILALVRAAGGEGIPDKTLKVQAGPYCSGNWSFTTVEIAGQDADHLEPLMVAATGKGGTLHLVGAGTDVCNAEVQAGAPPGIRVLACGF
jgi:hypothetical protein